MNAHNPARNGGEISGGEGAPAALMAGGFGRGCEEETGRKKVRRGHATARGRRLAGGAGCEERESGVRVGCPGPKVAGGKERNGPSEGIRPKKGLGFLIDLLI